MGLGPRVRGLGHVGPKGVIGSGGSMSFVLPRKTKNFNK